MKKIVIILLTAIAFTLPSCKKAIESLLPDQNPGLPSQATPTALGSPVGIASTKNIGSSGGSISSPDGRIELQIPAGALAGNTDVTIQPITNNAPNGVSNAYRFTPDGLKFLKAVTLKIHYTDNDAAPSSPDLMGIAFQDSSGIWWRTNNFDLDVANKTLSAPILHFSDWSMFEVMKIMPATGTIRVNQSINLEIEVVNTGKDEDELAPIYNVSSKITWNATEGGLTGTNDLMRTYKAPATIPSQNPVAISAVVPAKFNYHGKSFDKTMLVSNIKIYNGDEVYLLEIKLMETNWFAGIVATDSVSMRIRILDTAVTVYDITNFSWKSDPETLVIGNVTVAWLPDPDEGPVNIISGTGDIAIDFLGPDTRFLGLHFTHSDTHNPWYHKTMAPNVDEYWGGEATIGIPGDCSFNLLPGQTVYDNGNNDIENVRLTLMQ